MDAFDHLVQLVARLRAPDGCPWDRAQTPSTLRQHLIEEAHEAAHAIAHESPEAVRDELGDLLFVTLLTAHTYQTSGAFSVQDALASVCEKMVRRHPHVFTDATSPPDWDTLKRAEKAHVDRTSALDGVPASLPPLMRAASITRKAAKVGFDWPSLQGVRDKLDEEIAELDEAIASGDADAIADELGDVLFTAVNLSRFVDTSAHSALDAAISKFERRFRTVEALCLSEGGSVHTSSVHALERYWARAKEMT